MSYQTSERPISPSELFSNLLSQSYREIECEDESLKIKQQREVLLQLIFEYEKGIEKELIRIGECESLERLRLERIEELERLKREREIVEEEVENELNRVTIRKEEQEEKHKLTIELQQVRSVNSKIRIKLADLQDYVLRLEAHNKQLEAERNIVQSSTIDRMRINEEGWRENMLIINKRQETYENELKTKLLEKEAENLEHVRKEEQSILERNRRKMEKFNSQQYTTNIIDRSRYNSTLMRENQNILNNEEKYLSLLNKNRNNAVYNDKSPLSYRRGYRII